MGAMPLPLPEVISYPEMASLCLSMRLREIPTEGKIFLMTLKFRDFHEFSSFLESCPEADRMLLEWLLSVLERMRTFRNDFLISKKFEKKSKISRFCRVLLSFRCF